MLRFCDKILYTFSIAYQLSFTLINPEPHNVLAKWKIEDAIKGIRF